MTRRNALVTMAISDEYTALGNDLTFPLMRRYAESQGMDFVIVATLAYPSRHPVWECLERVYALLGEYERVLCLHVDNIIKPNARDVMAALPMGTFYGFDELPYDTDPLNEHTGKLIWEHAMAEWRDEFSPTDDVPQHLYNTGTMLVDRTQRELFRNVRHEISHGMLDMAVVNMRLHYSQLSHRDVRPEYFNASHLWFRGQPVPDILHVMWQSGTKREQVEMFMPRMGY